MKLGHPCINLALIREENERDIYQHQNNIYTRLRLFDGIASLCRFIELRMRNYEKGIPPKTTLGQLLQNYVFKGEAWFKAEVTDKNTRRKQQEFDNLIADVLKNYKRPSRSLLLLWVIRNYSANICNPESSIFFENLEEIFDDIIIAYIFYLKYRKILN